MNDMSSVIIPKSDQINADDFIAGPQTITIREVQIKGGQEQPVSIYFDASDKAFRPCKSMSRVLVQAWGPDAKVYIGRSLTLYRDPTVKWGGLEVGGIRISHLSHIDGKIQMQLTATKGQRRPHVVLPLVIQQQANGDGRAKAESWVEQFEKDMAAAFSDEEIAAVQLRATNALTKLAKQYPDLHARAQVAAGGAPGADTTEGRDTADMGENFNPATEEETAERLVREVRGKELLADLTAWERETQEAYDSLSSARQDQVDSAIAEQRQKLSASAGKEMAGN